MDKMIQTGKGETIITNDGNTMLRDMSVMHPAAKMLVDLSAAQDVEAGDGTTSVVVIAGSLLGAADRLLAKGSWARSHRAPTKSDMFCRDTSNHDIRSLPASSCGGGTNSP